MHRRAFMLLSSDPKFRYIVIEDLKKLMKVILEKHPGL